MRSAHVRLRNAIATGNVLLVDAAAAECGGQVALDDALTICLVYLDGDPERFRRASARWLGRLLTAESVTIAEATVLAGGLAMLTDPAARGRGAALLRLQLLDLGQERCAQRLHPQ